MSKVATFPVLRPSKSKRRGDPSGLTRRARDAIARTRAARIALDLAMVGVENDVTLPVMVVTGPKRVRVAWQNRRDSSEEERREQNRVKKRAAKRARVA